MKTTIQSHKNGSAVRTPRQTKSPKAEPVTVIFYSTEDDKELFRVEFPAAFYTKIVRACEKMKLAPFEFFQLALKEKLGRPVTPKFAIDYVAREMRGAQ